MKCFETCLCILFVSSPRQTPLCPRNTTTTARHHPAAAFHFICLAALRWLFAAFHRKFAPAPRGPKCSRFIKCHEGNTHTPCAPWIFVNRTVNCVYKNVCPVCMLLLALLQYAKALQQPPGSSSPAKKKKGKNTNIQIHKTQKAGSEYRTCGSCAVFWHIALPKG